MNGNNIAVSPLWPFIIQNKEYMLPIYNELYSYDNSSNPLNITVREFFSWKLETAVFGSCWLVGQFPQSLRGFNPDNPMHYESICELVDQFKDILEANKVKDSNSNFENNRDVDNAKQKCLEGLKDPISYFRSIRNCLYEEMIALSRLHQVNFFESEVQSIRNEFGGITMQHSRIPIIGRVTTTRFVQLSNLDLNVTRLQQKASTLIDQISTLMLSLKQEIFAMANNQFFMQTKEIKQKLFDELLSKLKMLISTTFIMITQPTSVVMTKAQGLIAAVFSIGTKLDMSNNSSAKLFILNEFQATQLQRTGTMEPFEYKNNKNKIVDIFKESNIGKLSQNSNGQCIVQIEKPQLHQNIRIANWPKDPNSSTKLNVTEQKFHFAIQAKFEVDILKEHFEIWALSLPFAYATHGTQTANMLGAIHFEMSKTYEAGGMRLKNNVEWDCFIANVSDLFEQHLGLGLSDDHKNYLRQKAFFQFGINSSTDLPTKAFFRNNLPGFEQNGSKIKGFSFCNWIFSAFLLLDSHNELKVLWKNKHIDFISKADAETKLLDKKCDTFLLRFADSQCGSISISCKNKNNLLEPQMVTIQHLQPFRKADFKKESITKKIEFIKPRLVHLVGDQTRTIDTVFAELFPPETVSTEESSILENNVLRYTRFISEYRISPSRIGNNA